MMTPEASEILGPVAERRTRTLRNLAEPIAASVFFAPEAHQAYARFGFAPAQGEVEDVALFDWSAYFATRAAPLGPVSPALVTAVFGVFPEAWITEALAGAWDRAAPHELLTAREQGGVAALRRLLGDDPPGVARASELLRRGLEAAPVAGLPLFAALRALPWPETAVGQLWRACDLYREHRGDAHVAAWTAAGLDGCQACLLNDLRQGLALGSYVRTRRWSDDQIDAAVDALRAGGWLDGDELSPQGRAAREVIEATTDRVQVPIVDAIGDDLDELVSLLHPLRDAIIERGGYPGRRFVERATGTGWGQAGRHG